jgi:hypothetical protein
MPYFNSISGLAFLRINYFKDFVFEWVREYNLAVQGTAKAGPLW